MVFRGINIVAAAAVLAAASMCNNSSAQTSRDQISPLVIQFDGIANIGMNAATTLWLQVWSTMRRAPWPNPDNLDFGPSIARWGDRPASPSTHSSAMAIAVQRGSHLVLWGGAVPYAGGIVVEPRVSVPDYPGHRRVRLEAWSVDYRETEYKVAFPNRTIDWGSTSLSEAGIEFFNTPFRAPVFKTQQFEDALKPMTPFVQALEFFPGGAKVRDRGVDEGYVKIPNIGGGGTPDVVYLVGGITRMMRGDWNGADQLFERILRNSENIRPSNLIDVHLLRGRNIELSGQSGIADFERAFELNPYSNAVLEHLLGAYLSPNFVADGQEAPEQAVSRIIRAYGGFLAENSDFRALPQAN